ncbi:MAG: orotidine-5'-phosphate decarboxylase [Rhodospirillales bacterium]
MAEPTPFYESVREQVGRGPLGCVGIDPSSALLEGWGLPDSPDGALSFALALLDAAHGAVRAVKPQVAYFERFGAEGYAVLARVIARARDMGLLVVADAKRGDISTTSDAYGQAWIGPSAPLQVDALTVTAYLGFGALEPIFQRAAKHGAYVFVVARSSNPEGVALQEAADPKIWISLLDDIAAWSERHHPTTVGAVVGATVPADLDLALQRLPQALFLAPGIGEQGATLCDLMQLNLPLDRVIASSSRAVAEQGPDLDDLREAIKSLTEVPDEEDSVAAKR